MEVINKLVDKNTGVLCGVLVGNSYDDEDEEVYGKVALSLEKATELDIDEMGYLEYLDVPSIEIFDLGSSFVYFEEDRLCMPDINDIPMERLEDSKFAVYGYVYESREKMPYDDEIIIKRVLDIQ